MVMANPRLRRTLIAEGGPDDLDLISALAGRFAEGELGEVEFVLRDVPDDIMTHLAEMQRELLGEGALPWPGNEDVLFLDMDNPIVRMRWQEGLAFLLILGAVLLRAIPILLAALRIATLGSLLRVGLVLLRPLIGVVLFGTVAIIALLLSWRVFKWVLGEVFGDINLPLAIGGGLAAVAGVVALTSSFGNRT